MKFDPMEPYTWKKNGISSRWGCHKKTEYVRDGLIVLAAVNKMQYHNNVRDVTEYCYRFITIERSGEKG